MRIYRTTPIVCTASYAVLLNEYGAAIFRNNQDPIHIDLPEAHEIILSRDGTVYACWFGETEFKLQAYSFDDKGIKPSGKSHSVDTKGLISGDLIVLGVSDGIELWLDSNDHVKRIWTLSKDSSQNAQEIIISKPKGDLLFSSGSIVGFAEDLGVQGKFLNLVDSVNKLRWKVRSTSAFTAMGRVFAISSIDPTLDKQNHGLHVFKDGQHTFIRTNDPVVESGGDDNHVVVSVFTGNDTELLEIINDNHGNLTTQYINAPSGYKGISLDGNIYTTRGFTNTFDIANVSMRSKQLPIKTIPDLPIHKFSPQEDKYVISRSLKETKASVIHFHGGPESYEVPEGRYFGLPQWCNTNQIDWIGVNYPGSLAPNTSYTRSAWHKWRYSSEKSLLGALELTTGPVVLAGWSFGAALALALGKYSNRIKGLLLGGVPGNLSKHIAYAESLDPNHHDWFAKRFDLDGDDMDFLSGMNGFDSTLQIMEIHGEDDVNCPAALANEVAQEWEQKQNPWERVWLPGGGHYASTIEDVIIISVSTRTFLTNVLLKHS